jgi:hypothetical protein
MPRPNNDEMEDLKLWNLLEHYKRDLTYYVFKSRLVVKQIKLTRSDIILSEDEVADGLRLELLGDEEWMNYLGRKSFLPMQTKAVITGYFARLVAYDNYSAIVT